MSVLKQVLRNVGGFHYCLLPSITSYRVVSSEALSREELQIAESVLARLNRPAKVPAASTEVPTLPPLAEEWGRKSRRCGALAVKLGMTQLWTKDGTSAAVTVLQVRERKEEPLSLLSLRGSTFRFCCWGEPSCFFHCLV